MADQHLGDEIVAAALSGFDAAAIEHLGDRQRKIAVFRRFYDTWRRASDGEALPFSSTSLLAASPNAAGAGRQLALLVDVVGIASDMAAELLEIDGPKARELLAEERRKLEETKVSGAALVIEDEPLIAMDIANLLESLGLKTAGMARTADTAVSLAKECQPDIVLADYDLGSGATGFDAIKRIGYELPVVGVFLTAYPDEVLSGEDFEPAFVLTKPFNERALRTAVIHSMTVPRTNIIT